MEESYSCQAITVLRGLEAVRRRPGMYIGDTNDGTGLHNMLEALVDWGVSEHEDGSATYVRVAHVGDAIVVEHDGDGLAVERAPGADVSAFEACFTQLHHPRWGLGPAVSNALSARMQVTTHHGGRVYQQSYERGEALGRPEELGATDRTGTVVRLVPDATIFGASRLSRVLIRRSLRLRAACHPRLTLLHDEHAFRAPSGMADLVRHLARGARWLHDEPIRLRAEVGDIAVDAALLWTDRPGTRQVAMVGDLRCPTGSHVRGLLRGIQAGFGTADACLDGVYPSAFREVMHPGLVWALHVQMPSPRIEGQLRERLNDPDAGRLVRTLVSRGVSARLASDAAFRTALLARLPRGV